MPIKTWKNRPQKLLIIGPNYFFQYCQPAQNQPKYNFLFHKNVSLSNLFSYHNLSRSSCSCCTIIIWPFGGIINLTRNLLTDLWWNIINDTMLCHQKLAACLCWTVWVVFSFSIAWNTYTWQGDYFSPTCRRCFSVFLSIHFAPIGRTFANLKLC